MVALSVFADVFTYNGPKLKVNLPTQISTVYYVQCDAALLEDHKPSRPIGRVGSLIDTCVDFSLNNLTHLVVNARRNGHIAKYPRLVFDDRHDDWRKEVFSKSTAL